MTEPIVIVGGGPVGGVLALALKRQGIPFTVLEARAKGASHGDQRALALSYGTKLILEKLNVWEGLAPHAAAIETIHISQRGGLGRTKLNAADHQLPALGYVAAYGALTKALDEAFEKETSAEANVIYQAFATNIHPEASETIVNFNVDGQLKSFSTPLAVIADGGASIDAIAGMQRETKEYGHNALVSKVRCELPHNKVAYERFTPQGPMALLPNGEEDFSLVWTGEKESVEALLALDDATFLAKLHQAFGDRVGRFLQVEKRISFPLKLSTLKPSTAPHLVVIGNAAQTMHPVAGQGFNVGIRDAWTLAELIGDTPLAQVGAETMLRAYGKARQQDTRRGLLFTDFLVNIFSNDFVGVSSLRGAGLGLLDLVKPAKGFLVEKMSYGK